MLEVGSYIVDNNLVGKMHNIFLELALQPRLFPKDMSTEL